jgi:exosortase/archaeosortase family protein
MIRQQIEKLQTSLPPKVLQMIIRGVVLFVGWMLLYHLLLKPSGTPDNQLTDLVVQGTVMVLKPFFAEVTHVGPHVFINGVQSVNIAPQCNGLELIVLYLGFLVCYPATLSRGIIFAIGGTIVITVLNMIRCALLAWLYLIHAPIFDVAHHFLFKLIIYGVVFLGWMLYTKESNKPNTLAGAA